ncbi:MAG: hypothetical protein K0U74_08600 [Alphaproteobacteria bacterium]|nr:hypothetical protein [Alphaproteobacteria bacterium]
MTADRKAPTDSSLVDAHVHLHPGVAPAAVLNAAVQNFTIWRTHLGLNSEPHGVLMLTEMSGVNAYEALKDSPPADWQTLPTNEDVSLRLVHSSGAELLVIAGRQIATSEGLEVLALGTLTQFKDRTPIADAVQAASASGALVVIPWGVGKWLGQRAKLIAQLIADHQTYPGTCFADTANRPAMWPYPKLLKMAEAGGRLVLPGSDPLPISGDDARAGSYGFVASVNLNAPEPFKTLRGWLASLDRSPQAFGSVDGTFNAIKRQVALRLDKR